MIVGLLGLQHRELLIALFEFGWVTLSSVAESIYIIFEHIIGELPWSGILTGVLVF